MSVVADQTLLDRGHRLPGPLRVGGAGDHRPGLGDRVDLALVVLRRAERSAVVEVGPPVPAAVPGVFLQRRRSASARSRHQAARAASPRCSARSANASAAVASMNQPFQTLSPLPPAPTWFMPSFQSPVPISGRPCGPSRQAVLQRAHAVLVDRPGHVAHVGQVVVLLLVGPQHRRLQERHPLVEQRGVAGGGDVVAGDEGQEVAGRR